MAKYLGRLTPAARVRLTALISQGHRAAAGLARARILLQAAADEEGAPWTDADLATALEPRASTVPRVRQACVEEGLTAAPERRQPTGRQDRKLAGAQAPPRLARAGRAPPA